MENNIFKYINVGVFITAVLSACSVLVLVPTLFFSEFKDHVYYCENIESGNKYKMVEQSTNSMYSVGDYYLIKKLKDGKYQPVNNGFPLQGIQRWKENTIELYAGKNTYVYKILDAKREYWDGEEITKYDQRLMFKWVLISLGAFVVTGGYIYVVCKKS